MEDRKLRQHVVDELEFEPRVNAAHIGVSVKKGIVTLSGHVSSYAEKTAAENATLRVHGVRAIASEIDVRYPGEGKTDDDEIAKRVLNVLKWNVVVPDDVVRVTVRKGVVTLVGELPWHFQKVEAENAVRKLSGVVGIINNIMVKPTVAASDIQTKIEAALKRHAESEAKAIRVSVQGDCVSLEGNVDNWDERFAVESAAWSVPGVRSVDDRLTVGR